MTTPRAKTVDEVREEFLRHISALVDHWHAANEPTLGKMEGLVHSILAIFDGNTDLPAYDIVARPHLEDKAYFASEGENWIEDGTVINDDARLAGCWFVDGKRIRP